MTIILTEKEIDELVADTLHEIHLGICGSPFSSHCPICKDRKAMKIFPVINLPVRYTPRKTELCYENETTTLAGLVVFVNPDGTVTLAVWDKNGIPGSRSNVPLVQFDAEGPTDGTEFCRIDPAYIGDMRILNAACERVNELQNQVTALTMLAHGGTVPTASNELLEEIKSKASPSVQKSPSGFMGNYPVDPLGPVADSEAQQSNAGLGNDVVPPLTRAEISQEFDNDYSPAETDEVKDEE